MELKEIKKSLIFACLKQDPLSFVPYLLSDNVKTEMPNKTRFYRFFKRMIKCAKQKSVGEWTLKIEKTSWNRGQDNVAYNFYDEKHKYARLSIIVTEKGNEIIFETIPF
ncbi:MAG: hypothetical protein COA33_013180 [Fluviicola sp.]|nr:hypothetical protein [Fluviicola sp.]